MSDLKPMVLAVCGPCRIGANGASACSMRGCVFFDCDSGPYTSPDDPFLKPVRSSEEMVDAAAQALWATTAHDRPTTRTLAHEALSATIPGLLDPT